MKYKVINKREILKAVKGVGKDLKESVLLSSSWDGPYAIAAIVVDNVMPKAEVHKKAVDVWRILKGEGKFIIGGNLLKPEQVSKNELAGDSIKNGQEVNVKEGDWIDIPAGVPHQVDARGNRLEMMIVKIFL